MTESLWRARTCASAKSLTSTKMEGHCSGRFFGFSIDKLIDGFSRGVEGGCELMFVRVAKALEVRQMLTVNIKSKVINHCLCLRLIVVILRSGFLSAVKADFSASAFDANKTYSGLSP